MEKEFAKMLSENVGKDRLLFFGAKNKFKTILKCDLEKLQQELAQYSLKLITKETANEDEQNYFFANIVKNLFLVKSM